MPNVLPTQNQEPTYTAEGPEQKHRIHGLGVFLTIILAVVVILLGERIMFDLNKMANPIIEQTVDSGSNYYPAQGSYLQIEKSTLSGSRIYYPKEKVGEYQLYKILVHGAFVLPFFLLMFLAYYWVNMKKRNQSWQVAIWAYVAGSIWMLLHLVGETGKYVIDQYKNAAIYIILIFLAVVLTGLAVFIQKKKSEA